MSKSRAAQLAASWTLLQGVAEVDSFGSWGSGSGSLSERRRQQLPALTLDQTEGQGSGGSSRSQASTRDHVSFCCHCCRNFASASVCSWWIMVWYDDGGPDSSRGVGDDWSFYVLACRARGCAPPPPLPLPLVNNRYRLGTFSTQGTTHGPAGTR